MLCCPYAYIGQSGDARWLTDRRQVVHEQILEWNGGRTPDRSVKASANRWYGELRKQNDATTLMALACCYTPYDGVLFIVLLRAPAILGDCNDHDDK